MLYLKLFYSSAKYKRKFLQNGVKIDVKKWKKTQKLYMCSLGAVWIVNDLLCLLLWRLCATICWWFNKFQAKPYWKICAAPEAVNTILFQWRRRIRLCMVSVSISIWWDRCTHYCCCLTLAAISNRCKCTTHFYLQHYLPFVCRFSLQWHSHTMYVLEWAFAW